MFSTTDIGGGAQKVAMDLLRAYRDLGHEVRMLVRFKVGSDAAVSEIDAFAYGAPWAPLCALADGLVSRLPRFRGQYRLRDWVRRTAVPRRWVDYWRGNEDFNYAYTRHLLDGLGWRPDVIHMHSVHGDFFDLHALPAISARVPVVWTLHDAWAVAGHCGYFMGCDRWRSGCGQCPDLRRSPPILRDRTAQNWRRKSRIYGESRLAVATPSRWLMNCVDASMLRAWRKRVIPYGIDLTVHRVRERVEARDVLGLPRDAFMVLAVSGIVGANPYKDFTTTDEAVRLVIGQERSADLLYVCLGENRQASTEPWLRYAGYVSDAKQVALYYQAANVLVHAAKGDNYPCVILEALASGIPVVATAVGGIPEEIEHGVTGYLVAEGDSGAMARYVHELMHDPERCRRMGAQGAFVAGQSFGMERQVQAYLDWFEELRTSSAYPSLLG